MVSEVIAFMGSWVSLIVCTDGLAFICIVHRLLSLWLSSAKRSSMGYGCVVSIIWDGTMVGVGKKSFACWVSVRALVAR